LTFEPHPVKILHPERGLKELFPLDDLVEQCRSLNLSGLIVHPFDLEFSRLASTQFITDYLVRYLKPKQVFVGHGFRFGRDRAGDFEAFRKLGIEYGFVVDQIGPFRVNGVVASSSKLRATLIDGDVETAASLLGRPFELRGTVVDGDKRGRGLGFPTANVDVRNELIPRVGVYLTELDDSSKRYKALTNVGFRPTFTAGQTRQRLSVETFVLEGALDLYSHEVRVRFLKRVRDEKKFDSAKDLVEQIQRDVQFAKEYFSHHV
jgi:riboflavin kinase/FMN adenylyltransferase